MMEDRDLIVKEAALEKILAGFDGLLVAFSGGVDSTLLLAVACNVLKDKVIAVTSASPLHPRREIEAAVKIAEDLKVSHILLKDDAVSPRELAANTRERCYVCKRHLGEKLVEIARARTIRTIAHGANLDDLDDFRPGFRAAREMGMVAPLMDAGFTKADIRALSKKMGLPTWDKPALACLATRIPYDTPITPETLRKIEAAETAVLSCGFSTCRVRWHGEVARIELPPAELEKIMETSRRETIVKKLREIGFLHIAVDLEGYRQGKLNRS